MLSSTLLLSINEYLIKLVDSLVNISQVLKHYKILRLFISGNAITWRQTHNRNLFNDFAA